MTWEHVTLVSVGVVSVAAVVWHALDLKIDGAVLMTFVAFVSAAVGVILPIKSPLEPKP